MLHSHWKYDKENDEFPQKIREGGSNDIADIIWEGDVLMMNVRLSAEGIWRDM